MEQHNTQVSSAYSILATCRTVYYDSITVVCSIILWRTVAAILSEQCILSTGVRNCKVVCGTCAFTTGSTVKAQSIILVFSRSMVMIIQWRRNRKMQKSAMYSTDTTTQRGAKEERLAPPEQHDD